MLSLKGSLLHVGS